MFHQTTLLKDPIQSGYYLLDQAGGDEMSLFLQHTCTDLIPVGWQS